MAVLDVWLTAVVARVEGWLTPRVAWLGSGLCCWPKPAELSVSDSAEPKSSLSGGSGGSGVLDPSLSSEEDIQRNGMSLKNRRN